MKSVFVYCVILSLLLTTSLAFAQDSKDHNQYFWASIGGGLAFSDFHNSYLAGNINASYQTQNYIVSARIGGFSTISIFGSATPNITEAGILYGVAKRSNYFFNSIACGLAFVTGKDESGKQVSTLGIPIEAQLFTTAGRYIGIGFYGIADLNLRIPYIGLLLCFQLGKLK